MGDLFEDLIWGRHAARVTAVVIGQIDVGEGARSASARLHSKGDER
ncbi:hypothetical protein [Xylanimonas protaetiae]|nr:hypothetical protein [Xylanimonas protaetiae]